MQLGCLGGGCSFFLLLQFGDGESRVWTLGERSPVAGWLQAEERSLEGCLWLRGRTVVGLLAEDCSLKAAWESGGEAQGLVADRRLTTSGNLELAEVVKKDP